MAFQFRALNKGFSALGTDVNPGPVGMKVLPHGRVIAEHFRTPFVGTRYSSRYLLAAIPFRLDPVRDNANKIFFYDYISSELSM